jgi:hypothetical protein
MKRPTTIRHEFVEFVPSTLEEGLLYVSIPYATAVHKCCCGCGNKVVTPLSPTDWKLTFDGETISLHPSIGNWSFACQSHYWINGNRINWAPKWSREKVEDNRARDRFIKDGYFAGEPSAPDAPELERQDDRSGKTFLDTIVRWIKSFR